MKKIRVILNGKSAGNPQVRSAINRIRDEGQPIEVRIGAGVAKTTMIGGRPWKFNLQYWHYVVSPDTFGPNHQIRIGISPVVALPW